MNYKRNIEKILITGISGSGGSYLGEYVTVNHPSVEIHGLVRWHTTNQTNNLDGIIDKIIIHECDLCDLSSVFKVLKAIKPDAIFHLAAQISEK